MPESMEYEFIAHYSDGEKLYQNFNKENEHHFGHIDQDRLEIFELFSKRLKKSYSVHLKTGEFLLAGQNCYAKDLPRNADYRLIYFRRVRESFKRSGTITTKKYCFGLQCDIEGRNYQVIFFIDGETGEVTVHNKK